MGHLKDKVIIVTGGAGSIGRALAMAFATEGAKVVVNDLGVSLEGHPEDLNSAEKVVREIHSAGGTAAADDSNVADEKGAENLIECALKNFGRIDGVVNNAGIVRDGIFHKMSTENWDAVIKVNLSGAFHVSRSAAPVFKKQGSGVFLHMVSTSGLIGNIGQANYSAAKMGLVGLSKSIALDMEKFGVRSNCVAPFAWSRMTSSIPTDTPEQKERVENFKKMKPEQIAPLCAFLLSDAAFEVNGQIFAIRNNEIFLMSQPRPLQSVHESKGWTVQTIADKALPALKSSFYELDCSADIFHWDPI